MGKYDDIIGMEYPVEGKHPRMPVANRAAQFAPFAALTGHEEAVEDTARIARENINVQKYTDEV